MSFRRVVGSMRAPPRCRPGRLDPGLPPHYPVRGRKKLVKPVTAGGPRQQEGEEGGRPRRDAAGKSNRPRNLSCCTAARSLPMRRLLAGTAIATLALALAASAQAGHGHGSHHTGHAHNVSTHVNHKSGPNYASYKFTGKKFGNSWCFYGKSGHYWTRTCWSRKYGCDCYWCPTSCCWYYWCAPRDCYYPVACYYQYPPVVTAAPAAVATATATATASASAAAGARGPTVGPDGEPLRP